MKTYLAEKPATETAENSDHSYSRQVDAWKEQRNRDAIEAWKRRNATTKHFMVRCLGSFQNHEAVGAGA